MIDCLILGDSIATGVSIHRPECKMMARVGITSRQFNQLYDVRPITSTTTIISLGTNDTGSVDTYYELLRLRHSISAKNVVWILPEKVNPKSGTQASIVRASIESIAMVFKDTIVRIPKPMADRYHPTVSGYRKIAQETRK